MRLSEQQIKDAILHDDEIVRNAALRYLSESHTEDASVMSRAIEAVETYGWEHVVHHHFRTFANLPLGG